MQQWGLWSADGQSQGIGPRCLFSSEFSIKSGKASSVTRGRTAPRDIIQGGGDALMSLNIFTAEFTKTLDKRSLGKRENGENGR